MVQSNQPRLRLSGGSDPSQGFGRIGSGRQITQYRNGNHTGSFSAPERRIATFRRQHFLGGIRRAQGDMSHSIGTEPTPDQFSFMNCLCESLDPHTPSPSMALHLVPFHARAPTESHTALSCE